MTAAHTGRGKLQRADVDSRDTLWWTTYSESDGPMFPQDDLVYQEMFDALSPFIRESVTPIGLLVPGGEVVQHGTGTLFAVADAHFIITAAHVLDAVRDNNSALFGYAYGTTTEDGTTLVGVPLDGGHCCWPDPLDIGVIRLTPDAVSRLTGRRFLRLSDVCLRPVVPGWGWVTGFPRMMAQRQGPTTEILNPLNWGSVISTAEPFPMENFDPRFHFVLEHDPATAGRLDRGPAIELPDTFGGISGCTVWQTWWPGEDEGNEWRSRRVRAVGVQTSCYRKHTIQATSWIAAAILICGAHPELTRVFEMHFPGWNLRDAITRLARPARAS